MVHLPKSYPSAAPCSIDNGNWQSIADVSVTFPLRNVSRYREPIITKTVLTFFWGVLRIKTVSSCNRHHSFSHYVNGFSHRHTVCPKPSCSSVNGCVVPHPPVPFGIRTIRPLTNKPHYIWCLGLAVG